MTGDDEVPQSTTSWTVTMFGWFSAEAARASRRKRFDADSVLGGIHAANDTLTGSLFRCLAD